MIGNAARAVRPMAEERRVHLAIGLPPEVETIRVDPVQLEQVFTNLLTNAVKFTPEGSTVHVESGLEERKGGEIVWVAVRDEGPGVGPEERDRIFEPLVRGRAAMPTGVQGVGLGLTICRRIVEAHGGLIEAVPSACGGLFRVALPVEA
jgi:two-component system sensor histidine kinase KdpD